jgi:ribosomal protein S4
MPYPGYMLNPGDMFQVEPESVMFATGAPKTRSAVARRVAAEKKAARGETLNSKPADRELTIAEIAAQTPAKEPTPAELKKQMQAILENAEDVIATEAKAKDKQKFREFRQSVKKAIAMWKTASPETVSTLDAQLQFLKDQLAEKLNRDGPTKEGQTSFSQEDQEKIQKAFEKLKEQAEYDAAWNQRDSSKPYLTPWRPRDYMPAFAFIPRYLEVNQNICAAVYLRHPVARPGLAEVPTPFPYETSQLAFNWYLRRR